MRLPLLTILLLLVISSPVRAEVPLSARVHVGMGTGGGSRDDLSAGGIAHFIAGDLLLRRAAKRSLVLTYERADLTTGIYLSPHLNNVSQEAVLIGIEHSQAGPGFRPYLHAGIGIGNMTTGIIKEKTSSGLALGFGLGYRLVSPARQMGLALGLRTSMVATAHSRSYFLAPTLGVAFRPR